MPMAACKSRKKTCWTTYAYSPRLGNWSREPTHTFTWHGTSGGHGLSMQSFVCRFLIRCFGGVIAGLIEIDTESHATVRCRNKHAVGAFRKKRIADDASVLGASFASLA